MTDSPRFIQIDEDGYLKLEDARVSDIEIGRTWLASMRMDDRGRPWIQIEGQDVLVEAFDQPYVALYIAADISPTKTGAAGWTITTAYGHNEKIAIESLRVDEWDRFHGRTERGIPFVISRPAQARLFDLFEEFDDESVVLDGKRITIQPWLNENPDANRDSFWSEIYRTETPRWELNAPSVALPLVVPRLKLQRARVLIAGAGSANDAAWFAEQGHIVTAVDFSEEALARARDKFGHVDNLKFVQADVFTLPASMTGAFDLVFEHTLYCAVTPSRRNELVKVWRRVLSEHGHLMGVFFVMDKPSGPPYGGSEWEIRSRLNKGFRSLYWTRMRESLPKRLGQELFVYAQKRPVF